MNMGEVKINQNLTPVKFPEVMFLKSKSDDIILRLETILKTIHSNHLKWEAAQKRGLSLCTSIETIKSRCLESNEKYITYYPDELKPCCDKLAVISSIFEDILKSTNEFIRQLTALSKLNKYPNQIFFRTWKFENFLNFVKIIGHKYGLEILAKRIITSEIAHSKTRYELMLHTSCWQYPEYVNEDMKMLFTFFTLEINNLIKS